jgi:pimeloyl-ACP methyl ester carboxylesterase
MTTDVTHHMAEANGIRMHIAEQGTGPTVLLCHGFPELWYSWRHQLSALAAAGFHTVAPDMRGYGQADAPQEIDRYTLLHAVGDMVGLLDVLGIAGHDWGATVAWLAPFDRMPVTVPALYIAGDRDPVIRFPGMDRHIADMVKFVPQLRRSTMLPGCGHITQEERPAEVNAAMIEFLHGLPG